MSLVFEDTATLYKVRKNGYGNDIPQDGVDVPAIYEQSTGAGHGASQDFVSSDGVLFLPPNNEFLIDNGYRLEGMVAKINVFGYEGSEQYFKIVTVRPMRDTLIGNKVRHVECDLEKVGDFHAGEDS